MGWRFREKCNGCLERPLEQKIERNGGSKTIKMPFSIGLEKPAKETFWKAERKRVANPERDLETPLWKLNNEALLKLQPKTNPGPKLKNPPKRETTRKLLELDTLLLRLDLRDELTNLRMDLQVFTRQFGENYTAMQGLVNILNDHLDDNCNHIETEKS